MGKESPPSSVLKKQPGVLLTHLARTSQTTRRHILLRYNLIKRRTSKAEKYSIVDARVITEIDIKKSVGGQTGRFVSKCLKMSQNISNYLKYSYR